MSSTLDLVVFGATGFTGRQAAHVIASMAAPGLRWAIAGRREAALADVAASLPAPAPEIIVADTSAPETIDAMVRRARVVLTTVGPYARYGEPVIAACATHGADYVDITGEVPWVRRMIDAYGEQAAASGARIVPFCGFDSVPADLGVWLIAEHLRERGQQLGDITAYYSMKGGLNGGTLATALRMMEQERPKDMAHPFLLNPDPKIDRETWTRHADPRRSWFEERIGRWASPFFMGPINTRVVRRTDALLAAEGAGYGDAFRYREAMVASQTLGRLEAAAVAGGQLGFAVFGSSALGRAAIRALGPSPGQGPSDATMDGGFFRARYIGTATDGAPVEAEMMRQGDPGNRVTLSMLCASALALVEDRDRLPARAGFLTPATAFGELLLDRLVADGLSFRMVAPA